MAISITEASQLKKEILERFGTVLHFHDGCGGQYFTLEKKLTRFLTMTLRSYNVPQAEIDEAIAFVLSLDIRGISSAIMHKLFDLLAIQFHFELSAIEK